MARSSVALFLVTTGLITATMGCGQVPKSKDQEGGENGVSAPAPGKPAAEAPYGGSKDDDGEGGEGGEE
ncbi:MAG: hypothetical protein KME02_15365 [Aphanothece saxicola GSE-SYN-MK-01-06B]|jgi:hypothetical protein|nr:hypothetical protein [Aphanothece saxicola GSE-SYN-MK-01-06B]